MFLGTNCCEYFISRTAQAVLLVKISRNRHVHIDKMLFWCSILFASTILHCYGWEVLCSLHNPLRCVIFTAYYQIGHGFLSIVAVNGIAILGLCLSQRTWHGKSRDFPLVSIECTRNRHGSGGKSRPYALVSTARL